MKSVLVILFVMLINSISFAQKVSEIALNKDEQELYNLIMQYRKAKKLPEIPISKSLTYVAQLHAEDLSENISDFNKGCNPHSWSDKGKWSSCCYTDDHKEAKCMWNKPRELTNYQDNGYEIVHFSSKLSPKEALDSWKDSKGHNEVIINEGIWKKASWKAIGIGLYEGYACVWFGKSEDAEK